MIEERVIEIKRECDDARGKLCRCSVCGDVSRCTPINDFYGEEGEPLKCEKCMLTAAGLSDKPMIHMFVKEDAKQDWYFTFGWGQPHQNCYTVIHGTYEEARVEMHRRYGGKWSSQYASAEEAGVEEFGLKKLL